jgi:hypothetical protein
MPTVDALEETWIQQNLLTYRGAVKCSGRTPLRGQKLRARGHKVGALADRLFEH